MVIVSGKTTARKMDSVRVMDPNGPAKLAQKSEHIVSRVLIFGIAGALVSMYFNKGLFTGLVAGTAVGVAYHWYKQKDDKK